MDQSVLPFADEKLEALFSAKAVERGGVVRRCRKWVEAEIGRDRLIREVEERGFRMWEVGGQYVVFCSRVPARRLV